MLLKKFVLADKDIMTPIIVEPESWTGVKKIAQKSADDIERVTGRKPCIVNEISSLDDGGKDENCLIYATIGRSQILDDIEKSGKISLDRIRGKNEVYGIFLVENPFDGVRSALVVAGSDKRGTIYGIFHISEQIGVSPMVYWGDAACEHKDELIFDEKIEMVSKEPSVQYRGFFINDEWPCFGNWTMEHFGGFNAKMYDHVFELLLRLKGNYLWPAMWTSSFALDGPGEESAVLADEYGVIIGNSHHEPCLRASEEWDLLKGGDSGYGTEWNYVTNKEGLLNYWRDGLKRSAKYDSIITVGMRGERDSVMQGADSLEKHIEVLKDIITQQHRLIAEYADTAEKKNPKLLAVYKEVEEFFYGSDEVKGLRYWDGLDDVILMLCDDNFGNMRTLPDDELRGHKAGFGMYYHLDYHGGPISYEWINSTPISKVWEQMTTAYEYGVRKVWIVNVGDLKGNEFPLSFFMSLAYDYEKWGVTCENATQTYTREWVRHELGSAAADEDINETADILTEGVQLLYMRRPEAMNSHVYSSTACCEADRMIRRIKSLSERLESMRKKLGDISKECGNAYDSTIYYPLARGMNLFLMHLYAGKNEHYARQGKIVANDYRDMVEYSIKRDKRLTTEFGNFLGGKWRGMELAPHMGFTKWNEDGSRYPLRMTVEPFVKARLIVSRADEDRTAVKNYGSPEKIMVRDFMYAGCDSVDIEVAVDGLGGLLCKVVSEPCDWIAYNWNKKRIDSQEVLTITVDREKCPDNEAVHSVYLTDGDATVEIEVHARKVNTAGAPEMTFFENDTGVTINAEHYAYSKPSSDGCWKYLAQHGRTNGAMKPFPITRSFEASDAPVLGYRVMLESGGEYVLSVLSSPTNPLSRGDRLSFGLRINGREMTEVSSVSETYRAGETSDAEWCRGVLDEIHRSDIRVSLKDGLNEIEIYALSAGFVLEKLIIHKVECWRGVGAYMGPCESFCSQVWRASK